MHKASQSPTQCCRLKPPLETDWRNVIFEALFSEVTCLQCTYWCMWDTCSLGWFAKATLQKANANVFICLFFPPLHCHLITWDHAATRNNQWSLSLWCLNLVSSCWIFLCNCSASQFLKAKPKLHWYAAYFSIMPGAQVCFCNLIFHNNIPKGTSSARCETQWVEVAMNWNVGSPMK